MSALDVAEPTAQPEREPYPMRAPCPRCGDTVGHLTRVAFNDVVRCSRHGHYCYCAPRSETGNGPATVRTRPELAPGQRTRIFLADGHRCVLCGVDAAAARLEIGHLMSVHEGRAAGMTDAALWADENLSAMCAECNSGLGRRSVPPDTRVTVLARRAMRDAGGGGDETAA